MNLLAAVRQPADPAKRLSRTRVRHFLNPQVRLVLSYGRKAVFTVTRTGDIIAMRRFLFILTVIASSGTAAAQEGLIAAGENVFETTCRRCHTIGPPTKFKKPGPDLNDVFGRKPGGLPDYTRYSDALISYGQDKVWDEETLTIFLHDPQGVVVNTHMAFLGLKNDEDIKAVLAYLATFDSDGAAPK